MEYEYTFTNLDLILEIKTDIVKNLKELYEEERFRSIGDKVHRELKFNWYVKSADYGDVDYPIYIEYSAMIMRLLNYYKAITFTYNGLTFDIDKEYINGLDKEFLGLSDGEDTGLEDFIESEMEDYFLTTQKTVGIKVLRKNIEDKDKEITKLQKELNVMKSKKTFSISIKISNFMLSFKRK